MLANNMAKPWPVLASALKRQLEISIYSTMAIEFIASTVQTLPFRCNWPFADNCFPLVCAEIASK